MPMYRQGHVMLRPVVIDLTGLPLAPGFTPGRAVIARGETGREHIFKTERVVIYQQGSDVFIEVKGDEPVVLEHPEHGDLDVDPGTYRLVEQIEVDPATHERQPRRSFPD